MRRDTIVALSSGALPSAIAVMRISGPMATAAAGRLAGSLPPPRSARVRVLRDPEDGARLDRALVLWFDPPHTATGEALVELHLHGSRAVVAAVERTLLGQDGVRRAEPGEFTRRALLNGRIDLTQAEGLGDLLAAETEGQRRAALSVAEGGVRRAVEGWSTALLELAARVEAAIDFSDEEDVEAGEADTFGDDIRARGHSIATEIAAALAGPSAQRLRDGIRVVLAGPPNSGKSTLFNRLVDREAAIVSPIAGTTRDRIEASVAIGGIAYVLTDTAGLNEDHADPIETIGIRRAIAAMQDADIVLWLGDDAPPSIEDAEVLRVHARCDLPGRRDSPHVALSISAHSGEGLDELVASLTVTAQRRLPRPDALALHDRHRRLLTDATATLASMADQEDLIVIAEMLRGALAALHRITGTTDTEAMLDTLFSGFCIGK
ncbi:tRNA uridine-5-carboxymethylaminomethyl(34) synthesis GTPase MnmE [Sphingomonas japonica]|uniref:tRNA modification GTPase MnmE n=1 Tax=Sphingomonas japonica TaxID=511662 RepID=A0ABX0U282_9SPHN|nr:tRNA uridine-5-carboxymethylaminomethyl(34) synthesis GTPase MnmE [Sphingomonas japonica]NIJ23482.1 tRNA modification GTPase [Sphingomonas japonica]